MKTKTLLIVFLTGIIFTSCQKEGDLPNREVNEKVLGTWNFVAMDVELATEMIAGSGIDQERMLSHYVLSSTNNKGTITFDETKGFSENLSYSYNTTVDFKYYVGGVFDSEFQSPMVGDMPASHGIAEYSARGADSLHFEKGFSIIEAPASQGGPVAQATEPVTVGLSWAKDTMVLTAHVIRTQNQMINGFNTLMKYNVRQVVKLKK